MDEVSRVRHHSRPGRTDFIFIMINNIIQSWTLNYFTKQSNGNLWQHKSTEANANVGEMYPEKYWCYKQHTQLTKMVTGAAIKSGMD